MIVALTKHSQCQCGVVDREDLRSVQIESVFAGKQFDFSKFRRLTEAGEGGRLRVERRADPEPAARLAGHHLDRGNPADHGQGADEGF